MTTTRAFIRSRAAATPSATVLALALLVHGAPAVAADAPARDDTAGQVQEVVVTARRRDERLQDVPIAVTALGETALRNLQAADLGDIQNAVPNLTVHAGDADNAVIYLRGVGQIDSLAFTDPGVGVYVDDVYLGRAQGAFLDVYDVQRIEVLRGPQGTLYGRNTIGGAVKFVSRPLTDHLAGAFEVGAGDYGLWEAKGSIEGPIAGDRLLAKAAFARTRRDGYASNAFDGGTDGDKDLTAGRLAFQFNASDDLTFRLNLDGSMDRPRASRTPARATPVFGFPATKSDPYRVDADFNDLNDLTAGGVSLVADWRLSDRLRLKSITAWRRMIYDAHLDLDATPLPIFGVFDDESQNQESQEFQLIWTGDRLDLVAGLYLFREHDLTYSGLYGPAIALVTGSLNDQYNRSYAGYGQANWRMTPRLSLTAGLRYTYETKDFARTQKIFPGSTPWPFPYSSGAGLLITDIDTSGDWSSVSPRLGLDYKVSDRVLTYLSASRGFKSGGFDGRANTAAAAAAYNPETLWAYEAGVKSTLFDHRLVANAALFWNDYTDLQLSSFVAAPGGGFAALFTNAGKATMRGAELELTARPTTALTLNGTVGYLDSHYDRYVGPGGIDISHQRKLVNAPRWDARLGFTRRFELGAAGSALLGADAAYRSKTYPTVSSSEAVAQAGYTLVNAFVRWDAPHGWWAELGGKNLTDRRYIDQAFDLSDSLGYQLAYYGEPRTVQLRLGRRF